MKNIFIALFTLFTFSLNAQMSPPTVNRSGTSLTQQDNYLTVAKRLGIPTSSTDDLDAAVTAQNSIKLLYNTTLNQLRVYNPLTLTWSGIGGSILASNGNYVDNDSVKLGGALTENTIIERNNNDFIISNDSSEFLLFDNSLSFYSNGIVDLEGQQAFGLSSNSFQFGNSEDSLNLLFSNLKRKDTVDYLLGVKESSNPNPLIKSYTLFRTPISSGGGGSSYFAKNGIFIDSDTIKLGGNITENTKLDNPNSKSVQIGSDGDAMNLNVPPPFPYNGLISRYSGYDYTSAEYMSFIGVLKGLNFAPFGFVNQDMVGTFTIVGNPFDSIYPDGSVMVDGVWEQGGQVSMNKLVFTFSGSDITFNTISMSEIENTEEIEGDNAFQLKSIEGDNGTQTDFIEGDNATQYQNIKGNTAFQTQFIEGDSAYQTQFIEGDNATQYQNIKGNTAFQTQFIEGDSAYQSQAIVGDTAYQSQAIVGNSAIQTHYIEGDNANQEQYIVGDNGRQYISISGQNGQRSIIISDSISGKQFRQITTDTKQTIEVDDIELKSNVEITKDVKLSGVVDGTALKLYGVDSNGKVVKTAIPGGGGSFDCSDLDSCQTITDLQIALTNLQNSLPKTLVEFRGSASYTGTTSESVVYASPAIPSTAWRENGNYILTILGAVQAGQTQNAVIKIYLNTANTLNGSEILINQSHVLTDNTYTPDGGNVLAIHLPIFKNTIELLTNKGNSTIANTNTGGIFSSNINMSYAKIRTKVTPNFTGNLYLIITTTQSVGSVTTKINNIIFKEI